MRDLVGTGQSCLELMPKFNLAGNSRRCWIFTTGQLSASLVWRPIFLGDCRECAGAGVPSQRIHLGPPLENAPSLHHLARGNPEPAPVDIHAPSAHPIARRLAQLFPRDHRPPGWLSSSPKTRQPFRRLPPSRGSRRAAERRLGSPPFGEGVPVT